MVSLLQAVQAGLEIRFSVNTITWIAPDGVPFTIEVDELDELQFHGSPFNVNPVPGILPTDQASFLYHAFDELCLSAQQGAVITTGRRYDASQRPHGFVIWSPDQRADVPRLEISPQHEISLFHRTSYLEEIY